MSCPPPEILQADIASSLKSTITTPNESRSPQVANRSLHSHRASYLSPNAAMSTQSFYSTTTSSPPHSLDELPKYYATSHLTISSTRVDRSPHRSIGSPYSAFFPSPATTSINVNSMVNISSSQIKVGWLEATLLVRKGKKHLSRIQKLVKRGRGMGGTERSEIVAMLGDAVEMTRYVASI